MITADERKKLIRETKYTAKRNELTIRHINDILTRFNGEMQQGSQYFPFEELSSSRTFSLLYYVNDDTLMKLQHAGYYVIKTNEGLHVIWESEVYNFLINHKEITPLIALTPII